MVSDGAASKAARMRCHALMASIYHDYNLTTNYQKRREEQFQKRGPEGLAFRGLSIIFLDWIVYGLIQTTPNQRAASLRALSNSLP